MNKKINLQDMLDSEIINLALSDVMSFKQLGHCQITTHTFMYEGIEHSAIMYYLEPYEKYPFHSVALVTTEKLFIGYRKYHAGFSFNNEGKVFPMPSTLFMD